MSLSQNVQDRYIAQRLIELTNPDDRSAAAIDTTRFNAAISDVEGDFLTLVGVIYDDTNKAHVGVAVEGVVLRLRQRMGNADLSEEESAYVAKLRAVAAGQGGRQRVVPATLESESDADIRLRQDLEDFIPEDANRDPDIAVEDSV